MKIISTFLWRVYTEKTIDKRQNSNIFATKLQLVSIDTVYVLFLKNKTQTCHFNKITTNVFGAFTPKKTCFY